MLRQWQRQLARHQTSEQAFVGHGNDRESEVTRLKRPIAVLEMERDILKNHRHFRGAQAVTTAMRLLATYARYWHEFRALGGREDATFS